MVFVFQKPQIEKFKFYTLKISLFNKISVKMCHKTLYLKKMLNIGKVIPEMLSMKILYKHCKLEIDPDCDL